MDARAMHDMMRYRTLAARHVVTLLPVFGDWKGRLFFAATGDPRRLSSSAQNNSRVLPVVART
jgi:hypothetical protein